MRRGASPHPRAETRPSLSNGGGCAGGRDKTGKLPRRPTVRQDAAQGRQTGSLQLRMGGIAKRRRNDPRQKPFRPLRPAASMGKRAATPRWAHWLARQAAEGIRSACLRICAVLPGAGCAANPRKRRPLSELARKWAIGCARLGDAARVAMASGRPAPRNRAAHPLRHPGCRNRRRI